VYLHSDVDCDGRELAHASDRVDVYVSSHHANHFRAVKAAEGDGMRKRPVVEIPNHIKAMFPACESCQELAALVERYRKVAEAQAVQLNKAGLLISPALAPTG